MEVPAANIADELVAFVQLVMDARITSPCFSVYGTPSCTKLSCVVSISELKPKPFKHAASHTRHAKEAEKQTCPNIQHSLNQELKYAYS